MWVRWGQRPGACGGAPPRGVKTKASASATHGDPGPTRAHISQGPCPLSPHNHMTYTESASQCETSHNVNVRLTVMRKRVVRHERLTRWRSQHRDRNVCNSVADLLTVSSKSASSSRGACSFCAHSASTLSSACCSVALASCHELSLRATGAHVVRSSLASAVLLCWSKSNDRRARTCSVAVVSTVDAAPAVRRASAHAPAHGARATVCIRPEGEVCSSQAVKTCLLQGRAACEYRGARVPRGAPRRVSSADLELAHLAELAPTPALGTPRRALWTVCVDSSPRLAPLLLLLPFRCLLPAA